MKEKLDLGKVISVEASIDIHMEAMMYDAACRKLSNNPVRCVEFPEELILDFTYERYRLKWSTFNIKKEDIKAVTERWEEFDIDTAESWTKEIMGYEFKLSSIEYTYVNKETLLNILERIGDTP